MKKKFKSDFKIIVTGNNGTGKSSYVNKWTKNIFSDTYKTTNLPGSESKIFDNNDGRLYRIQIWDLSLQGKYAELTKIFAKDSHGVIIVSDATNSQKREDVEIICR